MQVCGWGEDGHVWKQRGHSIHAMMVNCLKNYAHICMKRQNSFPVDNTFWRKSSLDRISPSVLLHLGFCSSLLFYCCKWVCFHKARHHPSPNFSCTCLDCFDSWWWCWCWRRWRWRRWWWLCQLCLALPCRWCSRVCETLRLCKCFYQQLLIAKGAERTQPIPVIAKSYPDSGRIQRSRSAKEPQPA